MSSSLSNTISSSLEINNYNKILSILLSSDSYKLKEDLFDICIHNIYKLFNEMIKLNSNPISHIEWLLSSELNVNKVDLIHTLFLISCKYQEISVIDWIYNKFKNLTLNRYNSKSYYSLFQQISAYFPKKEIYEWYINLNKYTNSILLKRFFINNIQDNTLSKILLINYPFLKDINFWDFKKFNYVNPHKKHNLLTLDLKSFKILSSFEKDFIKKSNILEIINELFHINGITQYIIGLDVDKNILDYKKLFIIFINKSNFIIDNLPFTPDDYINLLCEYILNQSPSFNVHRIIIFIKNILNTLNKSINFNKLIMLCFLKFKEYVYKIFENENTFFDEQVKKYIDIICNNFDCKFLTLILYKNRKILLDLNIMTKINVMISNAFILKKYYVIKWCLPYIGSTQILKKMLPYAITNKNLDLIIIIINYDYNYILSFQHNNSIIELLFIELVKNKNINLLIFIQNLNPNKFFVNINQPELSFIKGIKHTRFEDIQHEECNICLSTSESTVDIQINNCKHFFHKDCLTKWIKINNTCPTCRQIINSFSEIKLLQDFILPLKKKIKI
jgi:hypothetical protein